MYIKSGYSIIRREEGHCRVNLNHYIDGKERNKNKWKYFWCKQTKKIAWTSAWSSAWTACNAIALDRSCDIVDFIKYLFLWKKKLTLRVRYSRMNYLTIMPCKGKTHGDDLFNTINEFMTKFIISYNKTVCIWSDGLQWWWKKVRISKKNQG